MAARSLRVRAGRVAASLALATAMAGGVGLSLAQTEPARPERTLASGDFIQTNSLAGVAILSAVNLAPGHPATGMVTITNAGDLAGDFTLATANAIDLPGPGGGALSQRLMVTVTDETAGGALVYSGSLNAMSVRALGRFAGGEAHTYKFVALLPSGASAADDPYQGSVAAIEFVWLGTSVNTDSAPPPAPPAPAGPATPPLPGGSSGTVPGGDRTPPRLKLAGAARQRLKRQKGAIVLTATCDEKCSLAGTGKPSGRQTPKRLKMGWSTRPAPKGATTMTLKLDKRSQAAIAKALKARKRPVVIVTIVATDAAGNSTTATIDVALVR